MRFSFESLFFSKRTIQMIYKKQKYHARKTYIDNIKFDSKKEAKRYLELRDKLAKKEIEQLRLQVKYDLLPKQVDEKGKCLERKCTYRADFVYIDKKTGKEVVEDCKGMKTPEYKLKKKMMLFFYGIRIFES